jgi:uncharacterized integral membrane protein
MITVIFLAVLFLDQNRSPVPVKIILGDPHPIELSAIIIISILTGVLLSVFGTLGYKNIRKRNVNRKVENDHKSVQSENNSM